MQKLTGIVPPVCTPLTSQGELDVPSYKRLLDFLLDNGVNGIFALGSTSEVVYLTNAQRRAVLETAVAHVNGRVPVLAGVIDMTTPRVIEHVTEASSIGVDGIVATAPFYTRADEPEIEKHFRAVHDSTETPLWAYDIPVCVGNKLSVDLILRLANDRVISGLKDSSGDDISLRKLILRARAEKYLEDFSILTGSELLADAALEFGADGVVPGLANVDPAGYVRLFDHYRNGQRAQAKAEQERLFQLFDLVTVGMRAGRMGSNSSAIGGFKAGLKLRGIIQECTTSTPQIQLNDSDVAIICEYLEHAGLDVESRSILSR